MHRIYRTLLALHPPAFRAVFAAEMLEVFQAAAADARRRGQLPYLAFCAREIAGLLTATLSHPARRFPMQNYRWILYCGAAGLALAGLVTLIRGPEGYRSSASVRAAPAMVPDRFIPSAPVDTSAGARMFAQTLLSRSSLANLIQTLDLYPADRARMPLEQVVDRMRGHIRLRDTFDRTIRIEFDADERRMAQSVTRELVRRLIAETARYRRHEADATVQFLTGLADNAAVELTRATEAERAPKLSESVRERLSLDRNLALRQYETLRNKLADARIAQSLEASNQGPRLEVVDPPSLPEEPRASRFRILLVGLFPGLLIGVVITWLRSWSLQTKLVPTA